MEPSTVDYSAAATVTTFPTPLPLLRRPIPTADAPLLAFKSVQHFSSALDSARSKLISQCESGARIGCALRASERCRDPWWKFGRGKMGFVEREMCEEREMEECFEAAKEKCAEFAKEKCVIGFQDALVVGNDGKICKGSDLIQFP